MSGYEEGWAFVLPHYKTNVLTIMHCIFYMPLLTPHPSLSILQMGGKFNVVKSNHSNCIDTFLYQVLEKWDGREVIVNDNTMAFSF
jgi:hypothetical protein